MSDKFLVIDGSSLIHRAFFALPPLTTREGINTGAVYGFIRMFLKLLKDVKPKRVVVAFDKSRVTFRTGLFPDYKGQRKPTAPELKEQFPLTIEVLDYLNIKALEMDNYEADDIIGTFAGHIEDSEVIIVTGDRDELQLLDHNTKVMYTKRGISNIVMYDEAVFSEEYEGLTPLQLIDLKGLMGDTSDNIPGVPGVGPKTAMKLLHAYGSVEETLAHAEEVKGKSLKQKLMDNKEQALLSKKLATIYKEVPVDTNPALYEIKGIKPEAEKFFSKLEFKGMFREFAEEIGVEGMEAGEVLAPEGGEEAGMDNLFSGVPEINHETVIVDTVEKWQELVKNISSDELIYFTASIGGKMPRPDFVAAEIAHAEKIWQLQGKEVLEAFIFWLNTSPNKKVTVDAKEVYKVCFAHGMADVKISEDVALAEYLLRPKAKTYTLMELTESYAEKLPADVLALGAICEKQQEALKQAVEGEKLYSLYREIELPLTAILAAMELKGIKVDSGRLEEMNLKMKSKIDALEAEIRELAEEPELNVNSPKQLGVVLFEKLELPVIKKTKTGYSTNAQVLEELQGKHPIIEMIQAYRVLAKLHSTYLEGLKPSINSETGRIYSHFQQMVTETGRLSSTDPNLQNIPARTEEGKAIRSLFVPGEGYDCLMSCDYSQIELRVLAHISQDSLLLESFRENQDVHARTASEVFGVPLELVSSEMRTRAKAVNFGIVYGISDFGLSVQLGCSRKEAAGFIKSYFERYTGVKEYMASTISQAKKDGFVTTLLGRKRYLPDINNRNFNRRSFAERTAINTPIQGTAADIMKLAMIKVDEALKESGLSSRVLLQVHDELVLEVKNSEKELTAQVVREAMENAFKLDVKLKADVAFGENWAEAK